jgi:hypothetical protein
MPTTMQDLEVVLEDKPGTLAKATEAIASQQINLEGGSSQKCGGEGIFHALFRSEQDATNAKKALEKSGFKVRGSKKVVVAEAEDKPGGAAKLYRAIAEQEVNISFSYLATQTRMVIGSDEPDKVLETLRSASTVGSTRR